MGSLHRLQLFFSSSKMHNQQIKMARITSVLLASPWSPARSLPLRPVRCYSVHDRQQEPEIRHAGGDGSSSIAQPQPPKVVVLGGTGMLGSAVTQRALLSGWQVVSVSRSGPRNNGPHQKQDQNQKPQQQQQQHASFSQSEQESDRSSSHAVARLKSRLLEVAGDATEPSTFEEHLVGASAVVHTIGTLLEGNYKQYVSGLRPAGSFELANFQTARATLEAAIRTHVPSFVYISAAHLPPGIDPRYLSTKRKAEDLILSSAASIRGIILRPGFIYSEKRPATLPIATAVGILSRFKDLLPKDPLGIRDALVTPLRAEAIADAIVQSISDTSIRGVLSVAEIQRLADLNV